MIRYLMLAVIGAAFSGYAQIYVLPGAPVIDDIEAHYLNLAVSSDTCCYVGLVSDEIRAGHVFISNELDTNYAYTTAGDSLFRDEFGNDAAYYLAVKTEAFTALPSGQVVGELWNYGTAAFPRVMSFLYVGNERVLVYGSGVPRLIDTIPTESNRFVFRSRATDSELYMPDTSGTGPARTDVSTGTMFGVPHTPVSYAHGELMPPDYPFFIAAVAGYDSVEAAEFLRYGVPPSDAEHLWDFAPNETGDTLPDHGTRGYAPMQIVRDDVNSGAGYVIAPNIRVENDEIVRAGAAVIRQKSKVVVIR